MTSKLTEEEIKRSPLHLSCYDFELNEISMAEWCKLNNVPKMSLSASEEVCVCAAIKMPDGYIVRGHRHNDCFRTIQGIQRYKGVNLDSLPDGFMTTRNRFVDRKEGRKLQEAAGIKSADKDGYRGDTLFSEDLY